MAISSSSVQEKPTVLIHQGWIRGEFVTAVAYKGGSSAMGVEAISLALTCWNPLYQVYSEWLAYQTRLV